MKKIEESAEKLATCLVIMELISEHDSLISGLMHTNKDALLLQSIEVVLSRYMSDAEFREWYYYNSVSSEEESWYKKIEQ